ncbi:hypothetical protein Thermo_00373 [Thermoplasmatales archaeon]|nr:hypothetical protein Thermo_00373 [Thermoplasmatales archaeon]
MKRKMVTDKPNEKFELAPYYARYLSYLLDLVILFGITSLLFSVIGYEPLGYIIITNYAGGIKPIASRKLCIYKRYLARSFSLIILVSASRVTQKHG